MSDSLSDPEEARAAEELARLLEQRPGQAEEAGPLARDLAAFARQIGEELRSHQHEPAADLEERVLAVTTREDLGWRGDLRLVGGFLRERLSQSSLLRLAAASLLVHLIAVPAVLAYVLLRQEPPEVRLGFEPAPGPDPFEEAQPEVPEQLPTEALDEHGESTEALPLVERRFDGAENGFVKGFVGFKEP